LGRVSGDLVKILDGDDQLTEGQLQRKVEVMDTHPNVGWVTSRVLDLMADGSMQGFPEDPAEGEIDSEWVMRFWRENSHRAPVHPATLCMRTVSYTHLRALGGWMALPSSEDTGLLLALNAVSDGYFLDEVGLLYRKWPQQITATAEHNDAAEKLRRFSVIEARVQALADLQISWR